MSQRLGISGTTARTFLTSEITPLLALVDSSAASLGYKPGDTLVIEFSDGKRRELVLGGYLHNPTGFPYSLAQLVTAFVTPDTMEWLGGPSDYNMLAVSVAENPTDKLTDTIHPK